jgi:RNA polymerase sigma factor (sigma-70 family)
MIISGCIKNNRKAQELLYKKFFHAAAALCTRYIDEEQDAMEVVNDGFLKVFKHIHVYDSRRSTLYTWIRKIMINTAINFLQKKQIIFTSNPQFAQDEALTENDSLLKLDAEDLLNLIKRLPAATQLVFNLYTIEGFSHREIAGMLGISEGTSRWHLSDARKKLKQSVLQLKKST